MFEHLGDLSIAFIYSLCQQFKLYHPNIFLTIISFCTTLTNTVHNWVSNPYDSYKICTKNYYDCQHPIEQQFSEILNIFNDPNHPKYIEEKKCLLVEFSGIFDAGLLDVVVYRLKRHGLYAVAKSAPKIPIIVKIRTQEMHGTEPMINTNPDHETMNYLDWHEEELEIDLPELYEKRKREYQKNNLCYIMIGRIKTDLNDIIERMEYMKTNKIQINTYQDKAGLYSFKNKKHAKHKRNRLRDDNFKRFPVIKIETDHTYLRNMILVTQVNQYTLFHSKSGH